MQQLAGVAVWDQQGRVLMVRQEHADGEKHWHPPKGFIPPEKKGMWTSKEMTEDGRRAMAVRVSGLQANAVAIKPGYRKTWKYMTGCGMKRIVFYAAQATAGGDPGDIFRADPKRPKKPTFEWMTLDAAVASTLRDENKQLLVETRAWLQSALAGA